MAVVGFDLLTINNYAKHRSFSSVDWLVRPAPSATLATNRLATGSAHWSSPYKLHIYASLAVVFYSYHDHSSAYTWQMAGDLFLLLAIKSSKIFSIGTNFKKIGKLSDVCLYMVQVYLSQKHKRLFEQFYFHILACSQIWLIIHVHHHHFGCITKLTPKKKKKHTLHVVMCNSIHHTWWLFMHCPASKQAAHGGWWCI